MDEEKKLGKYRTTNWATYNAALKARGSLTAWLDRDMQWLAAPTGKCGRNPTFSDAAIQLASGQNGVLLLNPPYGERIEAAGVAGVGRLQRSSSNTHSGQPDADVSHTDTLQFGASEFFSQLASH